MKKIGLITLPLNNNFGGILQAFALHHYLTNMGFQVIFIDRQYKAKWYSKLKIFIKDRYHSNKSLTNEQKNRINHKPALFIEKYITPKSPVLSSNKSLKSYVKEQKFDAIIVGSDQVWRLEYSLPFYRNMFLDFVKTKNTKKLSYAASFGIDHWNHSTKKTKEINKLLNQFDAISVREDSGVQLCKNIFGLDALHHIDPTLLIDPQTYLKLVIQEKEPKSAGDILVYMLDFSGDRKVVVEKVEKSLNGKVFQVNKKASDEEYGLNNAIFPTVTSWLQGFFNAKFTVVDSFHGTIFSILFNIPFITYGNKSRGLTRFNSVLKLFELEERLILDSEQLNEDLINKPIDWEPVNRKIEELRKDTKSFLYQLQ